MSHPATITIERPERIANWRPVGQMILVLPQWVALHTVMSVAASLTAVYAWFAVLFTGNLRPGVAAFHAGWVRVDARLWAYSMLLTDEYPPFSID